MPPYIVEMDPSGAPKEEESAWIFKILVRKRCSSAIRWENAQQSASAKLYVGIQFADPELTVMK